MKPEWTTGLFNQFHTFAVKHKYSGDIDPVYPVLREVQRLRGNGPEIAAWHTLLYLAWYNLGSAEKVLRENPSPRPITKDYTGLSTGVERRGFRGNNKATIMVNLMLQFRSPLDQWLDEVTRPGGEMGWSALYHDLMLTKHNSTWAAFKWCDLVRNVLGYDITSPDIGLGGGGKNAGPVPGLVQLTGLPWHYCASSNQLQRDFYQHCLDAGIPWEGMEEMETALCDFNSVSHNRYYVGHDIDKQMEDIADCPPVYWEARLKVFPHEYLGECQKIGGWDGVRKAEKLKGVEGL